MCCCLFKVVLLNAKFLCILPVFPCLPGSLLHSTTGISLSLFFFNLDLQLCFLPGLTCFVWNVTSLFFCPHIDCFMGVSGYRGATSQEAVCNEIINIAEKSVHYCSTVSHPLDFHHKLPPSDNKSSLIISQQPEAQQRRVAPDRSRPSQDL